MSFVAPLDPGSSHDTPHSPRRHHPSVRDLGWSDLPLSPHDVEVLRVRGITPEIARARGYRSWTTEDARQQGFSRDHARDTLAVPNYSLAGEFDGYLLRPHEAPIDPETGKARKYLWRQGHSPKLGGPPAATPAAEARAHQLRDDMNVPVVVSESIPKGDSLLSHAETPVYPISIHGTWNWAVNGAPSPELRAIPWRAKKRDRIVQRRDVVLVPDSDYYTNPSVAFGWWTFGDQLREKNANVRIFVTPAAADGSKLGPDDALASGIITVAEILESAVPLSADLPEIARMDRPASDTLEMQRRIETLEADLESSRRHISLLTKLTISPHYTANEKILLIRGAGLAMAGDAEVERESGAVRIDPGKLSNDLRPTDKQHPDYEAFKRSPVNPIHEDERGHRFGGDHWYMRRSSVVPTIKSLEKKLGNVIPIRAKLESVRKRGEIAPHRESVILMEPPTNMVDFLQAVTSYCPNEGTSRPYRTQDPCRHCGEVHATTVRRYCGTPEDPGCGEQIAKETHIPVPPANRPIDDLSDDQRERVAASAGDASQANRKNLFTETLGPSSAALLASSPVSMYSENIFLRDNHEKNSGEVIDPETGEIMSQRSQPICGAIGCAAPVEREGQRCPDHSLHRPADHGWSLEVSA